MSVYGKGRGIVHCAASGLRYRPLVPIWGSEAITLQPIASKPDIKAWADRVSLNPARIPRIWPAPPN